MSSSSAASASSATAAAAGSGVGGALASLFSAAVGALGPAASARQPPRSPVTGLALCAEGLVTSSLDGVVRAWRPAR